MHVLLYICLKESKLIRLRLRSSIYQRNRLPKINIMCNQSINALTSIFILFRIKIKHVNTYPQMERDLRENQL